MNRRQLLYVLAAGAFAGCNKSGDGAPPPKYTKALDGYVKSCEARVAPADLLQPASAPAQANSAAADLVETAVVGGPIAKTAARSLRELGDPGIVAIERFVKDENHSARTRATAAALLAGYKDSPAAAAASVRITTNSKDEEVRAAAVFSIGQIGIRSALPWLTLRLKYETSTNVVARLAIALRRLGSLAGAGGLRELLKRGEMDNCMEAITYIVTSEGYSTPEEPNVNNIDPLLEAAQLRWHESGICKDAPPADPALDFEIAKIAARLGGSDLRIVDDARFIMSGLGAAGIPSLVIALEDESIYARVRAMEVLGILSRVADPAVDRLLTMTADPNHAAEVILTLGRIGSNKAHAAITRAAADPRLDVRVAAVRGLSAFVNKETVPILKTILSNQRAGKTNASPEIALLCIYALLYDYESDARSLVNELLQLESSSSVLDPGMLARTFEAAALRLDATSRPASSPAEWSWGRLKELLQKSEKK